MTDRDRQVAFRIIAHLLAEADASLATRGLEPDQSLVSSGLLDSVGVLHLVRFLEREFGVEVPAEDVSLENFDTVQSIVNLLKSYRAA